MYRLYKSLTVQSLYYSVISGFKENNKKVVLLLSMIYQLDFVKDKIDEMIYNKTGTDVGKDCSQIPAEVLDYEWNLGFDTKGNVSEIRQDYQNIDVLIWFGFQKVDKSSFCDSVRGWLAIIITLLGQRLD